MRQEAHIERVFTDARARARSVPFSPPKRTFVEFSLGRSPRLTWRARADENSFFQVEHFKRALVPGRLRMRDRTTLSWEVAERKGGG